MSTATLNGHRVTHARVYLPAWGIAWAEASIDEEVALTGAADLRIADLAFAGTIMSGGPSAKGRSSFRIAAGAGGWGKSAPRKSYANDVGVKAATVLADAAMAAGETLDAATLPTTALGPAFVRAEGPAARVLEQLSPSAWYVGTDGVTRIGRRASTTPTLDAQAGPLDAAAGRVTLAAESIASIVPGATIVGLEAVDVLHELEPGTLRTTVYGAGIADTSREAAAFRRILDQLDPLRRFRGVWEYRVVTQDGERLNLQPIRVSTGMPDLARVVVRPGVPGTRADVALGSRVLVGFVDADPARPVVLGFEDAEGWGFVPTKTSIDASAEIKIAQGTLGAARMTDAVTCGGFVGTITGASSKVRVG